jgi:RecB family exonuclease
MWEYSSRRSDLSELFALEYDEAIQDLLTDQPDLSLWQRTPRVTTTEMDIKLRREAGLTQSKALEARCRAAEWHLWTVPDSDELGLEIEFEIDLGGVPIVGAVDRVLEWPDGSITPEDLKSGNKKNTEGDNRQLGLYGYALNTLFGAGVSTGRYWYTKLDAPGQWVNLSRYTESYLTDQYRKLNEAIATGIFLANPGEHCDFCGVRPYCREMGSERA